MLVLAIDTSTKAGSVALFDDKKGLLGEIIINIDRNHSDTMMKAIDYLFEISKKKIDDLSKIAVTEGPGSFTGIRVGMGIVKGLVFGKNIEVVSMNTLDLLAEEVIFEGEVVPLIDARKGRVYYSIYEKNTSKTKRISNYMDGELEKILETLKNRKICFTGDASYIYKNEIINIMGENAIFLPESRILPKASILAEKALNLEKVNPIILEPYYHSKTQAEREKENKK
ncbi:MAG: tRNA (adenosine(37)-N6)-threonylcarbamoyltransferase complex dimerization subunit type 1 TsaB [Fusobacteriaceae bacterium]|nr:tRNA (adenosine(37)-N6)-threonylcarbamoyltransferase complex dimerization subunit type 1 TsaB [Fusobacteriaceae bacterium]MBN2838577.1 tRNA (adenosine(37)-N6)-threonylcarbamoyltransferase complex dimerization subunit type 1 TsaB [Fusobacteriaceae bacterium]